MIRHRKWGKYSGPMIRGKIRYEPREDFGYWEKIVWLTAQVESGGVFGTSIGYDGTGNTSGLIQAIGVYPKELLLQDDNPDNDQGPLWHQLALIKKYNPKSTELIEKYFDYHNLSLSKQGKMIDLDTGKTCDGIKLRNTFTPPDGRVPRFGKEWERAKEWIRLFNITFSNPDSFDAQILFGIQHMKEITNTKNKWINVDKVFYKSSLLEQLKCQPELNLALAIFYSFSVNAPFMAFRKLAEGIDSFEEKHNTKIGQISNQKEILLLSKEIIRIFGRANFGRWNSSLAYGRYQRTRRSAMKVWPEELFIGKDAVMPRKLI